MKTFENDSFVVEANEEAGCRLSLKIQVLPAPTKNAYKKAVKVVNKQISIPGFRKGRAPDSTVISKYGSHVEQEWKDIVVNDAYRAAVELTNIYPMSKESIQRPKIESCSQDEGAVVTLAYEHYPNTPEINFSDINLPEIAKEPVSEERLNEILEEVRKSHADWEDIEGREVQKNDYVDVSIDSIDVDPPQSIVKDRRLEVGDTQIAPWLRDMLIGMKVADIKEGLSEVDEKADAETKKNFKPTQVRVTLNAIKKIILPELTDELAKTMGADSVEDMQAKIRGNLEKEADEAVRSKRIDALENALLDAYPFALPASIVESERIERIRLHIESLKKDGVSDEQIKAKEQEIEARVSKEVDNSLRLYFLNQQIMKQGKISVSNQELNNELVKQISQNPYMYGKDMDEAASKQMLDRLTSSLMERKAKDYALEQVVNG